jgi:hypothetical protein
MDADAGVALTETDKEKSIDEAKPAEPLPDMGFSPDMDETGAGCAERCPSSFSNYLSSSRDLAGAAWHPVAGRSRRSRGRALVRPERRRRAPADTRAAPPPRPLRIPRQRNSTSKLLGCLL